MRIVAMEVVLGQPHAVKPGLVGRGDLLERVAERLPLAQAGEVGDGELVEEVEAHRRAAYPARAGSRRAAS
jgi:hypothetical protein